MLSESIESHDDVTPNGSGGPEKVREAVIEAARRLFSEKGIHAVSVREIAREVGVSHTLLHLYFGSKEAIVRQVLGTYDNRMAAGIASAEKIDVVVGDVFRALAGNAELVRVLAAALVEGIVPDRIESEAVAQRALVKRLEEQRDEDSVDPRVLSAAFAAIAIGWAVAEEWIAESVDMGEDGKRELAEQLATLLERMIRDYA